jgi:hypothetical protein
MNKQLSTLIGSSIIAASFSLFNSPVLALPALQLDIADGIYIGGSEESVYTNQTVFDLFGYCDYTNQCDLTKEHYISAAVIPQGTGENEDFGSFKVSLDNGTTWATYDYNNTTFGVPPLSDPSGSDMDAKDLQKHGVFETVFTEFAFMFDQSTTRYGVNVQDNPGTDFSFGDAATPLAYYGIKVDTSTMKEGYGLHFDLYNIDAKTKKGTEDYDIDDFAPFSHDAYNIPDGSDTGLIPGTEIPEPSSVLGLLALGLISAGSALKEKFRK